MTCSDTSDGSGCAKKKKSSTQASPSTKKSSTQASPSTTSTSQAPSSSSGAIVSSPSFVIETTVITSVIANVTITSVVSTANSGTSPPLAPPPPPPPVITVTSTAVLVSPLLAPASTSISASILPTVSSSLMSSPSQPNTSTETLPTSQLDPTPSSVPASMPTVVSSDTQHHPLSSATLIGIVVGGCILLVLVVLGLWRRRRLLQKAGSSADSFDVPLEDRADEEDSRVKAGVPSSDMPRFTNREQNIRASQNTMGAGPKVDRPAMTPFVFRHASAQHYAESGLHARNVTMPLIIQHPSPRLGSDASEQNTSRFMREAMTLREPVVQSGSDFMPGDASEEVRPSQSDSTQDLLDNSALVSGARPGNTYHSSPARNRDEPHWNENAGEPGNALWERLLAIQTHLHAIQNSRSKDTSRLEAEFLALREHIAELEARRQPPRNPLSDVHDPPPRY